LAAVDLLRFASRSPSHRIGTGKRNRLPPTGGRLNMLREATRISSLLSVWPCRHRWRLQ